MCLKSYKRNWSLQERWSITVSGLLNIGAVVEKGGGGSMVRYSRQKWHLMLKEKECFPCLFHNLKTATGSKLPNKTLLLTS